MIIKNAGPQKRAGILLAVADLTSALGQGDVQFQNGATAVAIHLYLNHIVTDLHVLADHCQ